MREGKDQPGADGRAESRQGVAPEARVRRSHERGQAADLSSLDRETVLRWLDHLRARGLTTGTIRTRWRGLRRFTNWLLAEDIIDTDPLAGLTALAKQVKSAGITNIDGEVLIDDRLFAKAHGSGSGPYLLTPIVVNDNLIDVLI